jgi:hypothetical protein
MKTRSRRFQAKFAREAQRVVLQMSAYTDNRLRLNAADAIQRQKMQTVLTDCTNGLPLLRGPLAQAMQVQVDRLAKALAEVAA